jgi:two-component system, OmpR family, alkaline phosphatase synthesis response regulator PhoP
MHSKSILIIDDETDILDFLSYSLKNEGYEIYTAENGQEGLNLAIKKRPDLILLDLMMPVLDGIETCQLIRKDVTLKNVLVVFLTSRAEDYTQVACLEAGADDFINKPIRPRVLAAKLASLLRRESRGQFAGASDNSSIVINREKFLVTFLGNEIHLPKKEFELLELLANRPGKVFSRDQILSTVWGDETVVGERTIDVHIRKLREKLGDEYIRTIKGVGYTFKEN